MSRPKTPFQQRQEMRRINQLRSDIVEKVNNKSSQLKKVFMMFDLDSSGTIEYREFRKGLECMGFRLGNDDFNHFVSEIDTDGNGYIDFEEFAKYLKMPGGQGARQEHLEDWDELKNQRRKYLGQNEQKDHFSKASPMASNIFEPETTPSKPRYTTETADQVRRRIEANNLRRMVKEKVLAKSEHIHKVFSLLDNDRNGFLDYSELKSGLERLGCAMSLEDFNWFITQIDPDGNGHVSYEEFAAYINEPEESPIDGPDQTDTITGNRIKRSNQSQRSHLMPDMSEPVARLQQQMHTGPKTPGRGVNKDIERLRKRLLDKLYGKTHNLTSIFRQFDEDKDGSVSYPEFKRGLHHLGLTDLTDHEFRTLCSIVDKDRDGNIEYNEFVTTVKAMESPYGTDFHSQAEAAVPGVSDISQRVNKPLSQAEAPAAGMRSAHRDFYGRKDTGESYAYHPTGSSIDGRSRIYSTDTMEAAGMRTGLKDRGYPNGR